MSQSCKTCKFAKWKLTENGRRKFGHGGACAYVLPTIPLPDSITTAYGFTEPGKNRRTIFADDGTTCPCYEKAK